MGKCSKCGKKIEYNRYKKVNGIVYCNKCAEKQIAETLFNTVKESKVAFDKFEADMKEVSRIVKPSSKAEEAGERPGIVIGKMTKSKKSGKKRAKK